ncbi:hypothetical protein BAX97_16930 [Elizabethkingia meningoseptica]|uniref:O-antigen polymerase n=1 Tax=Elizabethkingia meningoseptica TaxID=238 RepID=UPI00036B3C39|nr:O-antigen polymerase [Elizabethkingia meningoseptica]AQX04978.1 hypothetical protein BBD33_06840 [Elizabethkingia meningoseptica]AQX47019.1 hypothetical protein B5G46_06830 [Elizabethkingia meningoseptica]KUY18005.1 hypothetical protein ATB99_07065 [Elizabethkingia meningoseptica]MDE5489073.1 oligosaccharide repeat unit polymerase [Elizabethkingia meningoseptica]MVW92335.1 oligosaccharide repeat unit polymerase [Elizabethkingia meningoseptica]
MNDLLWVIFLLCLFLLLNIKLFKKRFSDPIVLHTSAWIIVFIIGIFNYDKYYRLNSFFWQCWSLWFVFFAIGYYIINPKVILNFKKINYVALPNYYFGLNIISFIFFILTIQQGLQGGYGNFMMNLRLSFILKTNTLLQPFFFLFTFIWPVFLYEGVVYKNKKNLIASIIFLLIYTLASGGKFGILMTVSAIVLIFNQRKRIKKKYLLIILGASMVLIGIMSIMREQSEDAFSAYTYAPLIAFQSLENTSGIHWGHETFRFFYSAFNTLGLSDTPPPEDFYDYIMTPVFINVYTVMRPFYVDFGINGIIFGALFYGLFFSYCYKGYLKGRLIQSSLYFGFAFAIVSVPFADLLFLNLSLVFRTIIICLLIFISINRKKI